MAVRHSLLYHQHCVLEMSSNMASVFKVYGITDDAKDWYAQQSLGDVQWEYDEVSGYHCRNI